MISFCGSTTCVPGNLCKLCVNAWEKTTNLMKRVEEMYPIIIGRALAEIPFQMSDGRWAKGLVQNEAKAFWDAFHIAKVDESQKMTIAWIQEAQAEAELQAHVQNTAAQTQAAIPPAAPATTEPGATEPEAGTEVLVKPKRKSKAKAAANANMAIATEPAVLPPHSAILPNGSTSTAVPGGKA